nr:hypothetical protein [Elstera litoralis]
MEDDLLGVAGEYRIRSVILALSDQGTTTDLTLAPPDAYADSGDPAPDSALALEEATP